MDDNEIEIENLSKFFILGFVFSALIFVTVANLIIIRDISEVSDRMDYIERELGL